MCVSMLPLGRGQALEVGFSVADFAIVVEDDVVLAPDALDWYRRQPVTPQHNVWGHRKQLLHAIRP